MKKFLSAIVSTMVLFSPLSQANLVQAKKHQDILYSNFTFKKEAIDSWDIYPIDKPVEGDCDDFAFSLQHSLGYGFVYLVDTKNDNKADHVVYVTGGYVFENDGNIYSVQEYLSSGKKLWEVPMSHTMK